MKAVDNYYKPTPKFWRKVGDAILGAGTVITIVSTVYNNPIIAVSAAVLTWVGKTLTNFASE